MRRRPQGSASLRLVERARPQPEACATFFRRLRRTACAIVVGGVTIFFALRFTPLPPALASEPPESAEFLDRNGQPLRLMLVTSAYRTRARQIALPT